MVNCARLGGMTNYSFAFDKTVYAVAALGDAKLNIWSSISE